MTGLTVIVTVNGDPDGLTYTLEGLCEQTTEEFDVLIVDHGCDEATAQVITSYCKEYVGFESIRIGNACVAAARNAGVKQANRELVWFVDGGDYLSPESVEKALETAEKTKADIICPRYYYSGDNEPYYLDWADMIALAPDIDKFDRALLNTLWLDGRIFKKKFFDLYSLTFPEIPDFYNEKFLTDCLFGCRAKVAGCAGAIYARRRGVFSHGFAQGAQPSLSLLAQACEIYDKITEDVKALIEEDTGSFDGDEYTWQEMLTVYFQMLTDRFYRYFWYLDDAALAALREKYEALTDRMTEERKKKISALNADLRFPSMFICRADAAATPMFSLMADFNADGGLGAFVESLFVQRFPFFELFVRESLLSDPRFPARWKDCPVIRRLPDANFFAEARKAARGVVIPVRDNAPLDPRILSELSVAKMPKAAMQYSFASKRKKYAAKSYLKKKGVSMR